MKNKIIFSVLSVLMAMSVFFSSVGAAWGGRGIAGVSGGIANCKSGVAKSLITKTSYTGLGHYIPDFEGGFCWWEFNLANYDLYKVVVKSKNPTQVWWNYSYTLNDYMYSLRWIRVR
ncbi:MAG TPA: hypothetical protein PK299_13425 [Anaerolineales bacterium]|nr:hypothetical protein [Anaerolineales bacterium]